MTVQAAPSSLEPGPVVVTVFDKDRIADYQKMVVALRNAGIRAELGPSSGELAQLFPQLAEGRPAAAAGDPAQAKLRLFESVVNLLELWAREYLDAS